MPSPYQATYIDTEGTFREERIKCIAEASPNTCDGLEIKAHPTSRMVILRKAIPAILIVGMLSAASIGQQTIKAQQRQNVNWEQLCIQYGGLVHTPCNELVVCLFAVGTLLLLGVDPTTVAMIGKAVREVCP